MTIVTISELFEERNWSRIFVYFVYNSFLFNNVIFTRSSISRIENLLSNICYEID